MRSLWMILTLRSLWRVLIEEVVMEDFDEEVVEEVLDNKIEMEDFLGKLKTTKYVLFRECRGEVAGGSIKIWKILCCVVFTAHTY